MRIVEALCLGFLIMSTSRQVNAQTGTVSIVSTPATVTVRPTGSPLTAGPRNLQDVLSDQPSIQDFGAKCDGSFVTALISIASGSKILTSTSAFPTAPVANQAIAITGAGATSGTITAPLYTTVFSSSSSTSGNVTTTTITLNQPAQTTVSSQSENVSYGTDDSAAVTAAANSGHSIYVPYGVICNAPKLQQSTMDGQFTGGGKIQTVVNQGTIYEAVVPRGPQFSAVRVTPNPGTLDNCALGFSCWAKYDYSHTLSAEEYHVSGATTLGQPMGPGAYEAMPGTVAHNLFIDNSSGWNYSHNSNDGRTSGGAWTTVLQNNGAGDFGVFGAHIQCSGTVPPGDGNTAPGPDGSIINGYTDWLAVPNCGFIGATFDASKPAQYMQIAEFPMTDHGNDVTAIGWEVGMLRTSTTAQINNRWEYELLTCNLAITATFPCDAVRAVAGSWAIGDDYIGANVPAPLAMSANQRITLNGSMPTSAYAEGAPPRLANLGGDYITDDGYSVFVYHNNAAVLRMANQANAVNWWVMDGSAAGSAVVLMPQGSDATITPILGDKGGSGIVFQSNNTNAARISTSGIQALQGSFITPSGAVGVSCAAGSISLSTMVVTNGIVTHC